MERNYYLGIMESLNEGIVVLNRDLTIQSINQFLLFFLNKDLSEVLGQKCHSIFLDEKAPCPGCFITEHRIFEEGRNFIKENKLEEAIEAYQKAVKLKPDFTEAY